MLVSGGSVFNTAEVKITALDLGGAVDPNLPASGFPSVSGVAGSFSGMAITPARATMIVDVSSVSRIYRVWR